MPPRIRARPEDFVVDEIPLYPPKGEGGHTFVHVEKRGRTTEEVARQLARAAGVATSDVGYAGRKDRHAITRQWLSLPGLAPEAVQALVLDGAVVLEAERHPHKLRTGQLRGNRFQLCVREVDEVAEQRAREVLARMLAIGMPNRFGSQRFGRDGGNAERARSILAGTGPRQGRRELRFLISALQSEVFNRVLAERPLPLDAVEEGDVAMVMASGGLFLVEDVRVENSRAADFEISATGPIFGRKMKQPGALVAQREAAAMEALGVPCGEALRLPRGLRVLGTRRALRVQVGESSLRREGDALLLQFSLPAGSYATVLLEELFGDLAEGPV